MILHVFYFRRHVILLLNSLLELNSAFFNNERKEGSVACVSAISNLSTRFVQLGVRRFSLEKGADVSATAPRPLHCPSPVPDQPLW